MISQKDFNTDKIQISNKAIVIFDDECVMCSWLANWLAKRDKSSIFIFTNQRTAIRLGLIKESIDTIILIKDSVSTIKSEAIINILGTLGSYWQIVSRVLTLIPLRFLNFGYDFIARTRYMIFRRNAICTTNNEVLKTKILM
jgi:predicted DCC family thiol-disulfide oxidoreductase YuxK